MTSLGIILALWILVGFIMTSASKKETVANSNNQNNNNKGNIKLSKVNISTKKMTANVLSKVNNVIKSISQSIENSIKNSTNISATIDTNTNGEPKRNENVQNTLEKEKINIETEEKGKENTDNTIDKKISQVEVPVEEIVSSNSLLVENYTIPSDEEYSIEDMYKETGIVSEFVEDDNKVELLDTVGEEVPANDNFTASIEKVASDIETSKGSDLMDLKDIVEDENEIQISSSTNSEQPWFDGLVTNTGDLANENKDETYSINKKTFKIVEKSF